MAIEKMTFLHLTGPSSALDETLLRCLHSGLFQPENTRKLSEYSVGASPLGHNPYAAALSLAEETASRLGVDEPAPDEELPTLPENRTAVLEEVCARITAFGKRYPRLALQRGKLAARIELFEEALAALEQRRVSPPAGEGVRLGRLPRAGYGAVRDRGEDAPVIVANAARQGGGVWCFHSNVSADSDEVYRDAGFQRVRLHDPPDPTGLDAADYFREGMRRDLEHDRGLLEAADRTLESEREEFAQGLATLRVLHDAFALRGYAVVIRERFHLIGFVMTRSKAEFLRQLEPLGDAVQIDASPAREDFPHIQTPVRLRNNWLVRPFEMFVTMYGSPSYNDLDPTPFVAYSYCLLFGMMFGDLGQGLCIALLGMVLYRVKGMALGGVMSRIGVFSMLFGFLYGSVFGFEEALDPFWIGVVGLHEKPIEVLRADMTNRILITAIALGCVIILLAILFNILTGFKHRDGERILLSHNGLPGLVFYGAALFAAVMQVTGRPVLRAAYVLPLIVLPLLVMFFGEPIGRLAEVRGKRSVLARHRRLRESSRRFEHIDVDLSALFHSKFIHASFGRIPTDSYEKLVFYSEEPFILHPIKSDRDYIWCVYAMAETDKEQIDAIFHDLYFERIFIPEEELRSVARIEGFIRNCIEGEQLPPELLPDAGDAQRVRRRTAFQHMFPDGVGAFVTQSFFEMFEVLLSFVTNTMSFLRVGGFILSHAGMMSVVFTLSAMAGGAGPVVIVIGNLFVMGLEGLIVGIQALRLEFYEIFSRFFDADGVPFSPVVAGQRSE